MNKTVLKSNQFHIEKDIEKAENKLRHFENLLSALNQYQFNPTETEFFSCVVDSDYLKEFLFKKVLEKTPAINNLPITEKAKREMIQLPIECISIQALHSVLPKDKTFLNHVYKSKIERGGLVLNENAIQEIKDTHSIYGNPKQAEANILAEKIALLHKEFKEKFHVGISRIIGEDIHSNPVLNTYSIIQNIK